MIIKDLFKKDITRPIQGVVTIGNEDEEQKWQELEEYVCTDEITKCFRTFFRRYRESINHPTEKMGDMSTEMVREFFYAVSYSAAMNLHFKILTAGKLMKYTSLVYFGHAGR